VLKVASRILSSSKSLLVLSLVLLAGFGGLFYAQSEVRHSVDRLGKLTINAERILTGDLRSTTAVRLAASLQSDRYILNYQDFQDAKYDLLSAISTQQKSGKLKQAFLAMEEIQSEIEDAEAEAISLIDEEKWEEALELVTEPAFRRQKGIYRANLSSALREMILDGEQQAEQARRLSQAAQYGVLATLVLLALIGWLYSRNMQTALDRQRELAVHLEDANKNLDQRVKDRTAELDESRTLFKSVLDNMPAVVFLKDRDGVYQLINSRYEEIYDVTLDEVVGKKLEDFVPESEIQSLADIDSRVFETGDVVESEHVREYKGEILTLASVMFPIIGANGEVTAYGGVELDITERKKAEESLTVKEAQLRAAMDNMTDGIYVLDSDQNYSLYNQRYLDLVKLPEGAVSLGASVEHAVRAHAMRGDYRDMDELSDSFIEARLQGLATNEAVETELQIDETSTAISIRKAPMTSGGAVVVLSDISERKRAEQALMDARDAAEEATKAKASFLATMSHEIRTPMGGVIGMVDILGETEMDDDQQQMLRTVKDSAHALLTIINDILDFSKIEAGKLDLEEIPVSLREVVEGVGEAMAVNARNKQISLSVFVDPDLPPFVISDQVRLRQILYNLGGNAVKFTERGKVLIRADQIGGVENGRVGVRLQVIDEGIGIPEKARATLFQAFSQVDESTTRRFGGTGLGLSICQRLTELMGGMIDVESVEGKGSAFSVSLSLPVADQAIVDEEEDLAGLNILLAIGDADLASLLPRYLTCNNARVEVIDSLEGITQAVAAAKYDQAFDVVVMGSEWPLDDKIDLVKRLKAETEFEGVRFLIACRGRSKRKRLEFPEAIYVDADPLQRTSFVRSVAIAAGRASPEVEYNADTDTKKTAKYVPTVEEAEAAGQLILLAEDNLTNQDVIRRQLGLLGYAVEIANDGVEALMLQKSKSYAILLTDCHMPNIDGFKLTRLIREAELDANDRMPIIAITASVMKEDVDACFEADMDDYLSKPLDMEKLKERLVKWMPQSTDATIDAVDPSPTTDSPEDDAVVSADVSDVGPAPVDPAALKSVFGDDEETFREILSEFVGPATANVDEIMAAFHDKAAPQVGGAAHKLKSSSRSVGANILADLCAELEAAGKSGDWEIIDNRITLLPKILQDVTDYIDNINNP
jgi:PAS domain S-box-containing protein